MDNTKEVVGRIEFDKTEPCMHPEHGFPLYIVLQAGKHTHTCPSCHKTTIVNVPMVTC